MSKFIIRRYMPKDEDLLFALIEREGDEWSNYWSEEGKPKYQKAIASSIIYLVFEDGYLCGYVRCRRDDGFGVYVYDLLVDKKYRGKDYGRLMMERVCHDYPNEEVYVLGDVYPYYEDRLGYEVEGKIYIVKPRKRGKNHEI